jgi:hypothetical protein
MNENQLLMNESSMTLDSALQAWTEDEHSDRKFDNYQAAGKKTSAALKAKYQTDEGREIIRKATEKRAANHAAQVSAQLATNAEYRRTHPPLPMSKRDVGAQKTKEKLKAKYQTDEGREILRKAAEKRAATHAAKYAK